MPTPYQLRMMLIFQKQDSIGEKIETWVATCFLINGSSWWNEDRQGATTMSEWNPQNICDIFYSIFLI